MFSEFCPVCSEIMTFGSDRCVHCDADVTDSGISPVYLDEEFESANEAILESLAA